MLQGLGRTHMEKSSIRTLNAETVCAVRKLIEREGSLRKAAKVLGVSHGVVAHIANERGNHVSHATENRLRLTLALPPIAPRVEVDPCPDCNGIHTGRCNNKPVAIRPVRGKREPQRIIDYTVGQLAWAIREREPYG